MSSFSDINSKSRGLHNRLVLFAAGWLIIGLLPFLTLTSAALKNNEYYLDLSLVGFSMLFALCVCYYQDKFYFSRYIVTPLLCIIMFLSAFQFNRDKAHTRYANQQPCINLLAYLKTNLPHVPNGSLLYFKGKDIERVYWLLGGGDAINLYYDNALVYFEGKDKTLPPNYSQIYFIELTGDVIKVSAPQQTTAPLAPPYYSATAFINFSHQFLLFISAMTYKTNINFYRLVL
jgi:hypothetical protein